MTKKKGEILAVLGAGNMGTAIAQVLADNGHVVNIWNWEGDHTPLKQIEKFNENKKYLLGVKLSKKIKPFYKIEEALAGAAVVFFAIPSSVMEHTISFASRSIKHNAILVDLSKGVEPHTLQLIPFVIAKHVRPSLKKNVLSVSGPAIAMQMAQKKFTAMNIAGKNKRAIKKVMEIMVNDYIKLVPTSDIIGVEVGGSFKNVYAIAMGMCDSMGYGLNTKAALLTRAIEEIATLIKAMGGRRKTAYELAGLGDLVGTALCPISRNRSFGDCLGKGMKVGPAIKKVKQVVEGVEASKCLHILAKKHKVSLPFGEVMYEVVTTKGEPRNVLNNYLQETFK